MHALKRWTALSALAACAVLFAGCGSEPQPPPEAELHGETREAVEAANRYLDERLDRLEAETQELRRDSKAAGNEMTAEWRESVAVLEQETAKLRREFDQLQNSGADAWHEFRARADRALNEIEQGLKDAEESLTAKSS